VTVLTCGARLHVQVALDMDETLVCAYREANLPDSLRTAAAQHAAGAFRLPSKAGPLLRLR